MWDRFLLSISVKSAQTSAICQCLIQNVPVSLNFATQKFFELLFNGAKSNPIIVIFQFQMHPDLSAHLHTDECNTLIKVFTSCQEQVCTNVHMYLFTCMNLHTCINDL